ncbi:MAG TPA: hypothetical protein VM029_03330, partial [Opitutaceae bacterium]|nr:hypothetical protein [Opitutaceae bacterium]
MSVAPSQKCAPLSGFPAALGPYQGDAGRLRPLTCGRRTGGDQPVPPEISAERARVQGADGFVRQESAPLHAPKAMFLLPRRALALLVFFTVTACPISAAPANNALIAATDILKIEQLASPEISPDGKSVVYTVKSVAEKIGAPGEYVYRTQLWLAATDGSKPPRALTHGEQQSSSPQWSPNGESIAFVRGESGKAQLWILPLAAGGEAFQLTRLEQGVAVPRWSPDGTQIAFTAAVTASEVGGALEETTGTRSHPTWDIERPGRKVADTRDWSAKTKDGKKPSAPAITTADGTLLERRDWLARNEADENPRVTTRLNFLSESDVQADTKFTNLFIIQARDGAKPLALAPDFESLGRPPGGAQEGGSAPAWSADGKWLFVTG